MGVIGYDVERLTPRGPVLEHHDGRLETDGPWLAIGPEGAPSLLVPAHAVIEVKPCEGRCRNGE